MRSDGVPDRQRYRLASLGVPTTDIPFAKLMALVRAVEIGLGPWNQALIWVVEHGVFASAEPLHLYYTLRDSYHEQRLLDEAPGHLFLAHEREDLTSFLYLTLVAAWDAFVFTDYDYGRVFLSHDDLAEISSSTLDDVRHRLDEIGIHFEERS